MKPFRRAFCIAVFAASLASQDAHAVTIPTVPIGNPGNPAIPVPFRHVGSVGYNFRMGRTEVTNAQYVEFLNAVAADDLYGLYDTSMGDTTWGGIVRSGSPGSYTYAVKPAALNGTYAYGNKPVVWVDPGDAMRFANWLHNGQPSGPQEASTTEGGAYTLNGAVTDAALATVHRNPGARWWLPSEDEWFKAAYHRNDGVTGNYWAYPTGTHSNPNNNPPSSDTGNSANFLWNGNYTTGNYEYPLTDAGAYTLSASAYGTFDQGGNVQEFTDTLVDIGFSSYRVARGGSWSLGSTYLDFFTLSGGLWPTGDGGFRVATIPEPSTLCMAALAVMGVLWRRRRTKATRARCVRALATAAVLAATVASTSLSHATEYTAVVLYPMPTPAGFSGSSNGAASGQAVQNIYDPNASPPAPTNAVLWMPDGSRVDLHPDGYTGSFANGTDGIHQFGTAYGANGFEARTPVVWSGSAASASFLPIGSFSWAEVQGSGGGEFVGIGELSANQVFHALLWNSLSTTPIDLHPTNLAGFMYSSAHGASGTQQVGSGITATGNEHALLWSGSADSAIDLNPENITDSIAVATDGIQQVGNGQRLTEPSPHPAHAMLWSGSAESAVDLHPPESEYLSSYAHAVRNGIQVGVGISPWGPSEALLWRGSAESFVNLHAYLPVGLHYSMATAIDDAGHILGVAFSFFDGHSYAIEWIPVAEPSGDFNHDGTVDAADYVLWRKSNGTQAAFDTWRANYGALSPGAAALALSHTNAAVPEPAARVLVALGLGALIAFRHTARRYRDSCTAW